MATPATDNPTQKRHKSGQVKATTSSWKPKHLVKVTVGPEMSLDQPYWEVIHTWRDLLDNWGAKHASKALFEWKHAKELGTTGIQVVAKAGVKAAETQRAEAAIEKAFYDTWQQATEQVRKHWEAWEKGAGPWHTNVMPDFRKHPGMLYTTMIRGPHDPERREQARSIARKTGAPVKKPLGWRKLLKLPPEASMRDIVVLLGDGKRRTFNAISVELWDKTADITTGKPPEEGLWMGTLNGYIEFSNRAPIQFRLTPKGKKWLKAGAKMPKQLKCPRAVMGFDKGIHPFQQEEDDEE